MADIPITQVRYGDEQARQMLATYIFAGIYGGVRVPRGIEPPTVSDFIRERLTEDKEGEAFGRAVDVIRFYERADTADHLARVFTAGPRDAQSLARAAYAIQGIADLGTPEQQDAAAEHFDQALVTRAREPHEFSLLLETAQALAPRGSMTRLTAQLDKVLARLAEDQNRDEQGMRAFHQLADVKRNELAATRQRIARKQQLLEKVPADRRRDLVDIYNRKTGLTDGYMESWSARMLRREAMEDDPAPVRAAFAAVLDGIDPQKLDPVRAFVAVRDAQAVVYLRGELTDRRKALYDRAVEEGGGALNFLWDDPEPA
jgi:hypothetical protein